MTGKFSDLKRKHMSPERIAQANNEAKLMAYDPPNYLAVVNHVPDIIKNGEVALMVDAWNQQIKIAAALWGLPPMAVSFHGDADKIPGGLDTILAIVRDDGNADSLGYHTAITDFVYGLVEAWSAPTTGSHEALEIFGNAYLDRLFDAPMGRKYWAELCDPTQGRHAHITADVAGVKRDVEVVDFVTPAWFGLPNPADQPQDRTTWLQNHSRLAPFEIAPAGYQIAQEENGRTVFLASERSRAFSMRPTAHSRTNRIRRRAPV